ISRLIRLLHLDHWVRFSQPPVASKPVELRVEFGFSEAREVLCPKTYN
ncbi:hypothetical protein CDAR_290351, partial [Caerostris darwini]